MTPAALHQLFGPAVPVYVMEMRTFLLFRVHRDGFKRAAEKGRYGLSSSKSAFYPFCSRNALDALYFGLTADRSPPYLRR